jgi:hypothetical protein
MNEEQVKKLIEESFDQNYKYGVPRIPPHTHNGVDNLKIPIANLLGSFGGGLNGYQVFTSSGTFIPKAGYTKYWVRAVGAGAGSWNSSAQGVGGGGGAYCEKLCDLTGVPSVTVTIGIGGIAGTTTPTNPTAGGNTTFGSYFTAGGGQTNGVGGTATGGDLNISGGPVGPSIKYSFRTSTTNDGLSGHGGNSMFGYGGEGAYCAANANYTAGRIGTGYGAGASGAMPAGGAGADADGANGTAGILIIMW